MAELELSSSGRMLVVPDVWFHAVRERIAEAVPDELPRFARLDHPYDHATLGADEVALATQALRLLVETLRARALATLGRGAGADWPGRDAAVDAVLRRQWADLDLTLAVLAFLDEGLQARAVLRIHGD